MSVGLAHQVWGSLPHSNRPPRHRLMRAFQAQGHKVTCPKGKVRSLCYMSGPQPLPRSRREQVVATMSPLLHPIHLPLHLRKPPGLLLLTEMKEG